MLGCSCCGCFDFKQSPYLGFAYGGQSTVLGCTCSGCFDPKQIILLGFAYGGVGLLCWTVVAVVSVIPNKSHNSP